MEAAPLPGSSVKWSTQMTCAQCSLLSAPFVIELPTGSSRFVIDALKQFITLCNIINFKK
jgi:hypothetical protein